MDLETSEKHISRVRRFLQIVKELPSNKETALFISNKFTKDPNVKAAILHEVFVNMLMHLNANLADNQKRHE